jgi:hypothetical protein
MFEKRFSISPHLNDVSCVQDDAYVCDAFLLEKIGDEEVPACSRPPVEVPQGITRNIGPGPEELHTCSALPRPDGSRVNTGTPWRYFQPFKSLHGRENCKGSRRRDKLLVPTHPQQVIRRNLNSGEFVLPPDASYNGKRCFGLASSKHPMVCEISFYSQSRREHINKRNFFQMIAYVLDGKGHPTGLTAPERLGLQAAFDHKVRFLHATPKRNK